MLHVYWCMNEFVKGTRKGGTRENINESFHTFLNCVTNKKQPWETKLAK